MGDDGSSLAIDDEIDATENTEKGDWTALKVRIKARCESANIPFETEILELPSRTLETIRLTFPNGRNKREFRVSRSSDAKALEALDFEDVTFLGDYDAIYYRKSGVIEASIRSLGSLPQTFLIRRLSKSLGLKTPDTISPTITIKINSTGDQPKITITNELDSILIQTPRAMSSSLLLRCEDVPPKSHDEAHHFLKSISNSIFFQIDQIANLSLRLVLTHPPSLYRPTQPKNPDPIKLEFPSYEYDEAPISLYWYARSATAMPLLQYLAYYQVLEFYFPTYFQREAGRRLQTVLKDPLFRPEREADITRLIGTIKTLRSGAIGSEKEQLRATIAECVTQEELFFLLSSDEELEFYRQKVGHLSKVRLNIKPDNKELRREVSDLVYDLRCKIVHTKNEDSDGSLEILLPFSRDSESMKKYLPLVQFLARKVLVASSTRISQ